MHRRIFIALFIFFVLPAAVFAENADEDSGVSSSEGIGDAAVSSDPEKSSVYAKEGKAADADARDPYSEYLRKRLVVTGLTVSGSKAEASLSEDSPSMSSFAAERKVTDWVPYLGSGRISKSKFFKLVGDSEAAGICAAAESKTAKMHTAGRVLTIGGGVLCAAGVGMMVGSFFKSDGDALLWSGLGVTLASCVSIGLGTEIFLPFVKNADVSADFALGLADGYNRKLAAELNVRI